MPEPIVRPAARAPRFLALILALHSGPALPETDVEFDARNGEHEDLFGGNLAVGQTITCRFALQKIDTGYKLFPHMEMVLYSDMSEESEIFDGEFVSLVASRTYPNYFIGTREHWHYKINVESADSDDSRSIRSVAGHEPVHTLTLALPTANLVLYLVGNDADDAALMDVPHLTLDRWKVLASGLNGKVSCTEKIASPASGPQS
jgi:hypothetical protein